jgi:DNA-binding MarR family transcriptional regulator
MTETLDQRIAERMAAELIDLIGPLRRGLRHRTREDWPLQPLTPSQSEALRVVGSRDAISVGELAAELHVAPNTASTLVGKLHAAGLVERSSDSADRRSVRVMLTAEARERIASWRDRRHHVLGAALLAADHADREAIAGALPPLRRLLERLER